jgi:hypothetical protein
MSGRCFVPLRGPLCHCFLSRHTKYHEEATKHTKHTKHIKRILKSSSRHPRRFRLPHSRPPSAPTEKFLGAPCFPRYFLGWGVQFFGEPSPGILFFSCENLSLLQMATFRPHSRAAPAEKFCLDPFIVLGHSIYCNKRDKDLMYGMRVVFPIDVREGSVYSCSPK